MIIELGCTKQERIPQKRFIWKNYLISNIVSCKKLAIKLLFKKTKATVLVYQPK